MLNNILIFIQENSFILGLCVSMLVWLQSRLNNALKQVSTLKIKVANMEDRFIEIEEKRIFTLEKKFDSLFDKYNELAQIISGMQESVLTIKSGVARIEDILMKR